MIQLVKVISLFGCRTINGISTILSVCVYADLLTLSLFKKPKIIIKPITHKVTTHVIYPMKNESN